jgi:hypothetical protein
MFMKRIFCISTVDGRFQQSEDELITLSVEGTTRIHVWPIFCL